MAVKTSILSCLVEIKEETKQFSKEKNSPLVEFLFDKMWMSKLAYLVDTFCHLNNLNTSMPAWASEGFFLGGQKWNFSGVDKNIFPGGGESG